MMQKGFKLRSDIHTVECDQLMIDSLRFDNQQLMQHCQRCEAMVRKLEIDVSQLSSRLATYEHVLTEY